MTQRWTEVAEYEGIYKVNIQGDVFSSYTNKILKPGLNGNGYRCVFLCKNGNIILKRW